jgi:hypothetical protein
MFVSILVDKNSFLAQGLHLRRPRKPAASE